ncbi:MAG: MgtC/SapB family protein [Myxococcales bacterium]|jgi:putative Mg2+ transporter-C (MgtC) family protein|nr:MAG: MgtC/SapB family protein [Myxococcales bacterium]
MSYFDPLLPEFWKTVGMAVVCGAAIGLERQLRGKPAGVRTSILVCLSTAIFVRLGAAAGGGDPSRVLGQIITGVGFLGAGVMLVRNEAVYGVTTAAVIWMLAATGCAIGFGYPMAALWLAMTTVATLTGVELLESSVRWLARGVYARRQPPRL